MKNWFKTTLGDCCEIVSGSTPSTNVKSFWNGNICWATPKDLSQMNGAYISDTPRKLTQLGLDSCKAKILPINSVLFSSRAPIGHVAVNTVPMATNQGFKSFVPEENKVYFKFLYHWLRKNRFYLESIGNGATFKEISKNIISGVEILLPPLEEQKKIAEILDQAEELRRKRREAIAQLDTLTQSIFIEMFGDVVKNQKNWKTDRMENLMRIRRGGSPRPIEKYLGGDINWIKIGDGTKGSDIYLESCADKITRDGLSKTVYLEKGSLIFANCGVSLGFARILKIDGCIHDGWLSFDNIDEIKLDKLFLLKALNSITNHFRAIAPDGTQPNLNTGLMKSFLMILPPLSLQKEFTQRVEAVEELKKSHRASLSELDALFASLQHRAFRGEL